MTLHTFPALLQASLDASFSGVLQTIAAAAILALCGLVFTLRSAVNEVTTLLKHPIIGLDAQFKRSETLASLIGDTDGDLREHGTKLNDHGVRLDGHDAAIDELNDRRRYKRRAEDRV